MQQCGTCEPLQSPTSSSQRTSDLKDKIAGLMLCVRDVILPLAKLAGTGHRGQMSAEPMSGLNPDEMDEEKGGICQTSATAKKKKPDGFQNWLHVHNACWRIGQHDPVAMLGQGAQT